MADELVRGADGTFLRCFPVPVFVQSLLPSVAIPRLSLAIASTLKLKSFNTFDLKSML
jgi:hypothetical protein